MEGSGDRQEGGEFWLPTQASFQRLLEEMSQPEKLQERAVRHAIELAPTEDRDTVLNVATSPSDPEAYRVFVRHLRSGGKDERVRSAAEAAS